MSVPRCPRCRCEIGPGERRHLQRGTESVAVCERCADEYHLGTWSWASLERRERALSAYFDGP